MSDYISQDDLAVFIGGIHTKTIYRWRKHGRLVVRQGRAEGVFLKWLNTAGLALRGGKVLIPWDHDELHCDRRYLGATQFLAALGADPVLSRIEESIWS